MLRIHCAAIQVGEVTYVLPVPAEHSTILMKLNWPKPHRQGFLTSEGNFVDRLEAGAIALAAGQVKEYNTTSGLISPQLWPRK